MHNRCPCRVVCARWWEFTHRACTVHAPSTHRVRYLNDFSRKGSAFEALVNTVPWWRLLGEELWHGMRAPLSELTCNRCSDRLKGDKSLHTKPNFACSYTAQVPSAASGTILGKSIGANSTSPLNKLKESTQQPLEDFEVLCKTLQCSSVHGGGVRCTTA